MNHGTGKILESLNTKLMLIFLQRKNLNILTSFLCLFVFFVAKPLFSSVLSSPQYLWYMRQLYSEYTDSEFLQQAVGEFKNIPKHLIDKHIAFLLQPVTELKGKFPTVKEISQITRNLK